MPSSRTLAPLSLLRISLSFQKCTCLDKHLLILYVLSTVGNKRSTRKENERREILAQKGIYENGRGGGGYVDENTEKSGAGIMEKPS